MRRGRALLPHPEPILDDSGRWIASRQVAGELTGRHHDWIRKNVPVVACHVPTGCLLIDIKDLEQVMAEKPARPNRRKASQEDC